MQENLRDRPVFICGHPKSGTSLLRSLLDAHPQLVVYPEETGFFRRYLPAIQGLDLEEKVALAEEKLIHIFTWNQQQPPPSQVGFPDRDYSGVHFEAVRLAMIGQLTLNGFRHDGDLLSAAILAFGQVTGQLSDDTLWWVEKTPYDERYAEQIYTWWPQARCIHIVRDPRDNFLSYHQKHAGWNARVFAQNWVDSTGAGLENRAHYGTENYMIVRYEDLVQKPNETLSDICNYLGIYQTDMLWVPTRNGEAWMGNSMFTERFKGISSTPVERWKGSLKPEDAGVIALLAGSLMGVLGYPVEGRIPARAYLRVARWRLGRMGSRIKK